MSIALPSFEATRMAIDEAVELTAQSLRAYAARHRRWSLAFSGGKDSSALLTLVIWLVETGRVPKPERMDVLYGDTRMELSPLWLSAKELMADAAKRKWIRCRTVCAPVDQRFFVYMLGRGVPPPNNKTLRWCTEQIKVRPMQVALWDVAVDLGYGRYVDTPRGPRYRGFDEDACAADPQYADAVKRLRQAKRSGAHDVVTTIEAELLGYYRRICPEPRKVLMLIGVRLGESAARDGRIALACSRNGAECGQGWYQRDLPESVCDKLSPLLHWRTCLIWDWLANQFPRSSPYRHRFPTKLLAEAYGLSPEGSPDEIGARTGCIGCPLAERETALDNLLKNYPEEWGYLAPLKQLKPIYRALRESKHRLRQPPGERRKDGSYTSNQNRMGPLTMEARLWALDSILKVQSAVNRKARRIGRPPIDILNKQEERRIRELIAENTWPAKWTGDEPVADELYEDQYSDGSRQMLLFGGGGGDE